MTASLRRAFVDAVSSAVYWFLTWLTRVVIAWIAHWDIEGAEHMPKHGGVLVACNHLHLLDPPLIAASTARRLHTMAKRELFDTPLIGWALWLYGAFPVRRFSADIAALRAARDLLLRGKAVMMFPEGTRSRDGRLHPGLPGAAMVALLADVPVVPIAIAGTESICLPRDLFGWIRGARPHVRVVFGEPFRLGGPSGAGTRQAEAATDAMMRRIAALLPESYQGAYGRGSEGQVVFARQEPQRG